MAMTQLRSAHTADLGAAALEAARALLYDSFADMSENDWEDAVGGVYVLPVTAALDLSGDLTCDWRDGDVW